MRKVCVIVFWLVLLTSHTGFAQFYESGQSPSSIKWRQINTNNFRLIYPETFGIRAFELASLLEEAYHLTSITLNHNPSDIPVIVHNYTARSNGMVVWAPRRMELFPATPQFTRGGDWLTSLAVHEQRHVVQIDKLNTGATKYLGYLFGEQTTGFALSRIPQWFLEGDAVLTETTLTHAGRGRNSSFQMPMRALLLSDRPTFSYDKFMFGSYKDFVPDHYIYGYNMVTQLRNEHGAELWENVLAYTGNRPLNIAPFRGSLKHQTGESIESLHKSVTDEMADFYRDRYPDNKTFNSNTVNDRNNNIYQSYHYPAWIGDSLIAAFKTSLDKIDRFVIVDLAGDEKSVKNTGILSSPSFTISENRIAWSEFKSDIRWGLQQFSIIKVYDMRLKREYRITDRSRLYAPVFAPDGLFLGAVEVDYQNNNSVVLLNSVTGQIALRHKVPDHWSVQKPVFNESGTKMYMAASTGTGMGILSVNIQTGEWSTVLAPAPITLSDLFWYNGMICFSSDISGINWIYGVESDKSNLWLLVQSEYGAYGGNYSKVSDAVVWSDYTAEGFNIKYSKAEDLFPLELGNLKTDQAWWLFSSLINEERGVIDHRTRSDINRFEDRPYRKFSNLLNIHSWSPFYFDYSSFDIEKSTIEPGLTLLSQNLLNSATTLAGYSYSEGRHMFHGDFIYKGNYPVFKAGFDYGDRPRIYQGRDTIGFSGEGPSGQFNFNSSVYLPLNLSSGPYIAGFEPRISLSYSNSLYHNETSGGYRKGMVILDTRFIAYRYLRRSLRDLAPSRGVVFRWQTGSAPFESENLGVINAIELTIYLPGLFPHHGLRIDGSIQNQRVEKYYFSSIVNFPRGYERELTEKLRVLRAGYYFPLFYPDYAFYNIIYLKRVYAEAFADMGVNMLRRFDPPSGRLVWKEEQLFSYGALLSADVHLFRLVFPFNFSMGAAWLPTRQTVSPLFSMGMNLNI